MSIVKHKHLEPHLFDKSEKLKPVVLDMLLKIAHCFINEVSSHPGMEIEDEDIKDIFIYGSSTNYFYNKKSDIDMCIIFDLSKVKARNPNTNVEQLIKLFYYDWECLYHCLIYGRKMDISFEDTDNPKKNRERYRTGGAYSLLKNNWIFRPVPISDAAFRDIKRQARKIYRAIMHDYYTVKKNGFQMDEIQKLYKDIHASKNASHRMNISQPITPMYIAFRWVRNRGVLDRLRQEAVKKKSAEFILK